MSLGKGTKTGGRKKGTPNKLTRAFREAVHRVYENIGGDDAFAAWAKGNKTEYYKIAARMIPTEIVGPGAEGEHKLDVRVEW